MRLVLIRDTYTPNETLGTMTVNGQLYQTMERPWIPGDQPGEDGGEPHMSCVPEGTYDLVLHNTIKHPRTFALVNDALDVVHNKTPGKRDNVLLHAANWARELEGCIAPGRERLESDSEWMVTESRACMRAILSFVPWETGHTIEIRKGA